MNKRLIIAAGVLLAAGSTQAMAQGFIRGEAGRSSVSADVTGEGSDSDHDSMYSIRGGYYFNKNFAVEGFYSRFYDKSDVFDDGTGPVTVNGKLSGVGLGIVGKSDFGNDQTGFFISGRAGVMHGKVELSATGFGSESDSSNKPYFGVGAGYDFSPQMGLSLNFDHYKGSGEDLSITARTISLGFEVRF